MTEHRHESRTPNDLQLEVWGVDARGESFRQWAQACDISLRGALLSLEAELRSGDLIGILYAGKKARYRVVWASRSGESDDRKIRAAVQRLDADECPWRNLLPASLPANLTNDQVREENTRL